MPSLRDARATADLDDLLADPDLDAVAVATPVPTHADLATRVLTTRIHLENDTDRPASPPDSWQVLQNYRSLLDPDDPFPAGFRV